MTNFSGMVTFQTHEDGAEIARRMVKDLQHLHFAVPLGRRRSLIYWIGTDDILKSTYGHAGAAEAQFRADWAGRLPPFGWAGTCREHLRRSGALPVTEDLTQIDRSRLRRFHEMEAMTVPRSMQSSTPSRIARWPMSLTAHPI